MSSYMGYLWNSETPNLPVSTTDSVSEPIDQRYLANMEYAKRIKEEIRILNEENKNLNTILPVTFAQ